MATKTKARPRAAAAAQKRQSREPPPEPAAISGQDIKRLAPCAGISPGRWSLNYIELSLLGLAATNGRILCVLSAPGWPYHCLLDPKTVRNVPNDARLSIDGAVKFVSRAYGREPTTLVLPHENPDEVVFPKWHGAVPEACNLQPIITVNAALLRKLLAALERAPDSSVTIYARPDDCLSPMMLGNEAGDMGLQMPVMDGAEGESVCHFPAAIYQSLGMDAKTLPPVFIPKARPMPTTPDGQTPAPSQSGGGLLG